MAEIIYCDQLTNKNDTINGTTSSDILNGLTGDDVLNGLRGNDLKFGNLGNDLLNGGTRGSGGGTGGNDTLDGGDGADIIFGGDGTDLLTGGAGNGVFRASNSSDLSGDTITDFDANDQIILQTSIVDSVVELVVSEGVTHLNFTVAGWPSDQDRSIALTGDCSGRK